MLRRVNNPTYRAAATLALQLDRLLPNERFRQRAPQPSKGLRSFVMERMRVLSPPLLSTALV
jgi:hypothetical protein